MLIQPPQTMDELAALLEINVDSLTEIAAKAPYLYSRKKIPRKGKPPRIIEPPHDNLKIVQRALLLKVLPYLRCDSALFAYKGTNHVDAVIQHISAPIIDYNGY